MLYKCTLLLLLGAQVTFAQHAAGINYDNYAAPVTNLANPAGLGSSKLKIGFNIINAEAQLFTNYARWNAPFSFISFFTGTVPDKYRNDRGLILWKEDYTRTNQKKERVDGAATIVANGPSIFYNFGAINLGVQAGLNIRGFGSFADASEEIGRHIVKIRPTGLYGTDIVDKQAIMNLGYYKEAYLSVGKTVYDRDSQRFKVGITGKFLTSSNFLGINATSIDFRVSESAVDDRQSRTQFDKTAGLLYFVQANAGITAGAIASELLKVNSPGRGLAGTVGLIYEFRPDHIKHSKKVNGRWVERTDAIGYQFKVGVSVEDVGFMKYANANVVPVVSNDEVIFDEGDFKENAAPGAFFALMERKYQLDPATYSRSFTFLMPARVHVFLDYKYEDKKFVTAFINHSVFSNERNAFAGVSSAGVVPRYETTRYSVSVPILLLNNYRSFTFGLSGRFGGFFLGTNHVPGFFNFSKTRGASVYGGLFVPFYAKGKEVDTACYYPSDQKKKPPFFSRLFK